MSNHVVTATFETRGEAERAHSQFRALGIPDAAVSITGPDGGHFGPRADEVGEPDASGSLSDLQGSPSDEPGHDDASGQHTPYLTLKVDLTGLGADPRRVVEVIHAAGGRTDS